MKEERAVLIGICRPIPNALGFVTPIFRDGAGAAVAQMVRDGRIIRFQQVDLGEEFVTLRGRASAAVGDPALYAMEFEDCISIGPAMSEVASGGELADWSEANAIRAAFGRNRIMKAGGFLTFRRRMAAGEQFEGEFGDEVVPNRGRGDGRKRHLKREWSDAPSIPMFARRSKRIASSGGITQLYVGDSVGGVMPMPWPEEVGDARLIEWFGRWRKPIRSWLRNRANVPPSEIDDLAQEVFLRLLRYTDDTAVDNAQGYLFRIAANVVNEWRNRSMAQMDDSGMERAKIDSNDESEHAFARNRANEYIRAAVEQLPQRQREILLLHAEQGLSYKQIAQQTGLSYRIVLRDLTRAYCTLRMHLRLEDL
jgi:RNA polymerase sigma factor (sigma-70 family)